MTDEADFRLSSYHYELPEAQIAQEPTAERGASRLLVVNRTGDLGLEHRHFSELCEVLPEGALLVANNSRVLPARLHGLRSTGGKVEFLLLTPLPVVLATARPADGKPDTLVSRVKGLMRCGGHLREGEEIGFGAGLTVRVGHAEAFGRREVDLLWTGDLADIFRQVGSVPLPPYIRRAPEASDSERYQTVYAREEKSGSVAAPTAGLHFTPALRERLAARGFGWREVTLYVGYGTFSPVREADIREHVMHEELIEVPEETAAAVNAARAEGRPVIAVGTTSVRTLEGCYAACGRLQAYSGTTNLFLYPGKPFHVVDGLITNFHIPGSSLIMLVSAFAGRRRILEAYGTAVAAGYRFFSYGDAMFIRP